MKYLYLCIASLVVWFTAGAQENQSFYADYRMGEMLSSLEANANADALDPERHAERVQERNVRNQKLLQSMDAIVMSRNYQFIPNTFQVQPAGNPHIIYSSFFNVRMTPDYADVDLPYVGGAVPPYTMTAINNFAPDIKGYKAVQTKNGWDITFSTRLGTVNTYQFELQIYSLTGEGILTLSTPTNVTVTYTGMVRNIN